MNTQETTYSEVGTAFGVTVSFRPYSHEDGADFDAPGLTLICHERPDEDIWNSEARGPIQRLADIGRTNRGEEWKGGGMYDIEESFRAVTAHDNEAGGPVQLVESIGADAGYMAHYLRPGYSFDDLRRAMRAALTERATDVVGEWTQANPEANQYQYDNYALVLQWEREAVSAVLDAWEEGAEEADNAIKAVSRFDEEGQDEAGRRYVLVQATHDDAAVYHAERYLSAMNPGALLRTELCERPNKAGEAWKMYFHLNESE